MIFTILSSCWSITKACIWQSFIFGHWTLTYLYNDVYESMIYQQKNVDLLVGGWTNPIEKYHMVKLDHETPRIGVNSYDSSFNILGGFFVPNQRLSAALKVGCVHYHSTIPPTRKVTKMNHPPSARVTGPMLAQKANMVCTSWPKWPKWPKMTVPISQFSGQKPDQMAIISTYFARIDTNNHQKIPQRGRVGT